jgi:branched-subunit amino acid transport protein
LIRRWIALKFLQEIPEAIFLAVHAESILGEAEVSALETSVPVRKGRNFLSESWIALKFLQEFPDAVLLAVDVKSVLGEAEVSALETRLLV